MVQRTNKFGNHKCISDDGKKFDSIHERDVYYTLRAKQQAGEISDLQCQKPFELIPTQYKDPARGFHKTERSCSYIADFVYKDSDGKTCVVDAKPTIKGRMWSTAEYKVKRKLMRQLYGIEIKEL